MDDRELARQLRAYVDATTEPVPAPTNENRLFDGGDLPPKRAWVLVAAAVAAIALLGALVALTGGGDHSVEQLDRPERPATVADEGAEEGPVPTGDVVGDDALEIERDALARATAYFEALSTNDAEAVLSLSDPTKIDADAETDVVRWWWTAAWPDGARSSWPSAPCRVIDTGREQGIDVSCPVTVSDPVAAALGLDELTWSVLVTDDGLLVRDVAPVARNALAYTAVWQVYADYLGTYRAAEYAARCGPDDADVPADVEYLILDGECAQATAGASDTVALWLAAREQGTGGLDLQALTGYWINTAGFDGLFVDFRRDGTFGIGNTGRLQETFASGTYELESSVIRFTVGADSDECVGETWSWRVGVPFDGLLEVDTDPNGGCAPAAHWQWVRVSPTSPAARRLADDVLASRSREPGALLPGIWLRTGTSEVLAIADDRSYVLTRDGDTLSPADVGVVTETEPGTWVLTSGGGACGSGSSFTWTDVRLPVDALDHSSTDDITLVAGSTPTCGGEDAPASWLLLSPERNG